MSLCLSLLNDLNVLAMCVLFLVFMICHLHTFLHSRVLSVAVSELETDVSLKMVVEGPAIDQNMVERESVLFVVNSFDI